MSKKEYMEIPESEVPEDKLVSITDAAKYNGVTRQAIYVAIKLNKLKAHKGDKWTIHIDDLIEYREKKYCRTKSMFNGEPLFDNNKGYFSINQVARQLGVHPQKIYYATRSGFLKAHRKGAAWVIHSDDVIEYTKTHLASKDKKTLAS
jgi:excisionase family DNA binding protein